MTDEDSQREAVINERVTRISETERKEERDGKREIESEGREGGGEKESER